MVPHSVEHRLTSKTVVLGVTSDVSLHLLRGFPEHLAARGWHVHLVSSAGPRLELFDGSSAISVHSLEMQREPSPLHDFRSLFSWVRLLRRIRPDVVSVGTPKAGLLGAVAAYLVRVPVRVYLLRGLRLETSRGVKRWILTLAERVTMRCSTDVLAVSESLRKRAVDLRLTSDVRIRVLAAGSSNGVDTSEFDPARFAAISLSSLRDEIGLSAEIPTIGFVGRLTKDKGLYDLASALEILSKDGVMHQLLVVGGKDDASSADTLTRLKSLNIPVITVGHVQEPAQYYALMDVFCLPSYREGFPNAVLEASSMGVPVVVSDATGMPDSMEDNVTGISTPVSDPAQLAQALKLLLTDHDLASSMRVSAREWVRSRFERAAVQAAFADDLDRSLASAVRPKKKRSS